MNVKFCYLILTVQIVTCLNMGFLSPSNADGEKFAIGCANIICNLNAKNVYIYYELNTSFDFMDNVLINMNKKCFSPKISLTR